MKQCVQNTVMSYQKIYERKEKKRKEKKRKEILKDSERSTVRREEGCTKDDTCKEIAKVYCLIRQVQKFLSLNLDNYKHPKVSQTSFHLRSVQILRHFVIQVSYYYLPLLFSFRENSENEKFFYTRKCERKLVLFPPPLAGLPQAFRTLCPTPSCHERPVILHTRRQIGCGINITIPFLFSDQDSKLRHLLPIPYYFSLKNKNLEALSEVG